MRALFPACLALLLAACGSKHPGGVNQPPSPRIVAPADGDDVPAGTALELRGTANDAEDGALGGASLAWASDQQGALGTGAQLTVSLAAGTHHLALTATDSKGLAATAQIVVHAVLQANRAPVPVIDAPVAGTQVDEGNTLLLQGHATDAEDGALPGSSLSWSSSLQGSLGVGSSLVVTLQRGTHTLVLTATDRQGLSAVASVSIEVVAAGANHAPTATITAPADGASFLAGQTIGFTGTGADVDNAPALPSLSWSSSLDGALGTGPSVQTNVLRRGAHVITLTATDQDGAKGMAQIAISVVQAGNHPPVPVITAPTDGTSVFAGTAVALAGSASDIEDGTLSGTQLVWSSSRDGTLGTGTSVTAPSLTVGAHTIRLVATDSAGDSAAAEIALTVLAANTAPTVTISSPADGAQADAGQVVQLRGAAQDAEDGALTGQALSWTSSLDGLLGHGASLDTQSLRAGQHTLTLSAVDSGGRTGSAQVSITVRPAQVNLPPIARLQAPSSGLVGQDLAFDGTASSDPDGTVAQARISFGDASADVLSATAVHRYAAEGIYTVTLTVTDDKGATGTATAAVTITAVNRIPGVIDGGHDALGGTCSLGLAGSSVLIAYHDETHPAVRLATVTAAQVALENVDGMGLEVCGAVTSNLALAVAPDGTPHVAYAMSTSQLFHAAKVSGSWQRQRVDGAIARNTSSSYAAVGIAVSQGQPIIAYNDASYRTVIATPAASGWSATSLPPSTGTYEYFLGGLSISADGVVHYSANASGPRLLAWNGTAVSGTALGSFALIGGAAPVVLDSAGVPVVLGANTVLHAPASGLTTSTFEEQASTRGQLAAGPAGTVWVAFKHDANLELAHAAPGGFWERVDVGPMDDATPSIAVDASGVPHACFFRAGKLMLY